jgi:hypothetical protein
MGSVQKVLFLSEMTRAEPFSQANGLIWLLPMFLASLGQWVQVADQ